MKQMAPRSRHSCPYTVSSDEWVSSSPSSSAAPSQVLSLHDLTQVQLASHFGAVLKIFTKIFAIAKVMHVVFLAYGLEVFWSLLTHLRTETDVSLLQLDHAEMGLLLWIKRAEVEIRTDSLATLIEVVENLFYVLYSRLVMEMASIELCALFKMEARPMTTRLKFVLPEPNHLYRILLACKDFLDSPVICEVVQKDLVSQYQQNYIHRITLKHSEKVPLDDILGFRRFAVNIVSDRTSIYYQKWNTLITIFDSIPADIMAVLAEKYLTVVPRIVPEDDVPFSELPFVRLQVINPVLWAKETILDHRIATLAKLQGRSVGEERREDGRFRLLSLAKQQKCICISVCSCAYDCTYNVERQCPCAEAQLRLMLARRRRGTGPSDFAMRATTLGRVCFEGLANLKRNVSEDELELEISNMFEIFELEIQKERSSVPAPVSD